MKNVLNAIKAIDKNQVVKVGGEVCKIASLTAAVGTAVFDYLKHEDQIKEILDNVNNFVKKRAA